MGMIELSALNSPVNAGATAAPIWSTPVISAPNSSPIGPMSGMMNASNVLNAFPRNSPTALRSSSEAANAEMNAPTIHPIPGISEVILPISCPTPPPSPLRPPVRRLDAEEDLVNVSNKLSILPIMSSTHTNAPMMAEPTDTNTPPNPTKAIPARANTGSSLPNHSAIPLVTTPTTSMTLGPHSPKISSMPIREGFTRIASFAKFSKNCVRIGVIFSSAEPRKSKVTAKIVPMDWNAGRKISTAVLKDSKSPTTESIRPVSRMTSPRPRKISLTISPIISTIEIMLSILLEITGATHHRLCAIWSNAPLKAVPSATNVVCASELARAVSMASSPDAISVRPGNPTCFAAWYRE